ncbi:MAG: dehydrogenase [Runella slithyformis]|nr:MAG: dehydrogenase [Runella slithyformis]TAH31469.1 MAG: dehydrogenase [Cytophagales bacterium]
MSVFQYDRRLLNDESLFNIYKELTIPRLFEEKMLVLLRQGKISKWFSGIGQEAISVGCTLALENDDIIFPMHRNLGVFTARGMDLYQLFTQFQGKMTGFSKGRERSFHFGSMKHHIVGMISHLGPQLSLANGVALADKIRLHKGVALAFTGDGATSQGEFHEALNVAAVWQLPVIFVIENNGYGLSTPTNEQYRCKNLIDKAIGYGMESIQIDGNNILEVYHTIRHFSEDLRHFPRPILVEAMTFRMRGHEEASGVKYVPTHLFDIWKEKDPVENFEHYILKAGIATQKMVLDFKESFKNELNEILERSFNTPFPVPNTEEELNDLYAPFDNVAIAPISDKTSEKRLVDAISDGLRQSMEKFDNLVLMGQDIAEYGGVFKITQGFVEQFGKDRVRNTPLCESAIVGTALGLSLRGMKAMVEMQFADFVTCGFNQIINNLAKIYWRWEQKADVVIRMPTGAGVSAGPFHSQSNEAWFFHTPGLKVIYPSNPYDAKGLLCASFEDENPIIFFEHKYLYRSTLGNVPDDYYTLSIGKAKVVQQGTDATIITYGLCVHYALEIVKELGLEGQVEIIDLCTLLPWDKETVEISVKKTGKVLVCNEDTLTGSIASEIAAWIGENCFQYLDAPVMREGSLDTPVPFSSILEQNFLPKERMKGKLEKLMGF